MRPAPVADYVITPHARFEMTRRGLSEETVRAILAAPEQRLEIRPGRLVLQSRVSMETPKKTYLVYEHAEVVTAYRTRRIAKYWREES